MNKKSNKSNSQQQNKTFDKSINWVKMWSLNMYV